MLFALGLLLVVIALIISMRRLRPVWWRALTIVLVALGLGWTLMNFAGLSEPLGATFVGWVGYTYVALCAATMLSAFLVLERRGPGGVERAPIIGDNPFDGDPDDTDDLEPSLTAEEIEAAQEAEDQANAWNEARASHDDRD